MIASRLRKRYFICDSFLWRNRRERHSELGSTETKIYGRKRATRHDGKRDVRAWRTQPRTEECQRWMVLIESNIAQFVFVAFVEIEIVILIFSKFPVHFNYIPVDISIKHTHTQRPQFFSYWNIYNNLIYIELMPRAESVKNLIKKRNDKRIIFRLNIYDIFDIRSRAWRRQISI